MNFLNRIRQQPEPVRHALFWGGMIVAALFLAGVWALSVHSTITNMAVGKSVKEIMQEKTAPERAPQLRSLTSFIGARVSAVRELFLKAALPKREEIIK